MCALNSSLHVKWPCTMHSTRQMLREHSSFPCPSCAATRGRWGSLRLRHRFCAPSGLASSQLVREQGRLCSSLSLLSTPVPPLWISNSQPLRVPTLFPRGDSSLPNNHSGLTCHFEYSQTCPSACDLGQLTSALQFPHLKNRKR